MATVFSMGVSLDGYIAGPGGDLSWTAPDPELHRFHNEQTRALGAEFCGRRLYEVMLGWETAAADPSTPEGEFAGLWQALPKVVFSTTLREVQGNARLAGADPATELAMVRGAVEGDIAVGGAGLAATFTRLGLIDEYRLFVSPTVLGAGTPFFRNVRLDLELVETRTFGSRVVYLRYRRAGE